MVGVIKYERMFSINLTGKTAVITGASQGIGKAISEVFAECGALVVLLSRNQKKLEENVNLLKNKGYNAEYFVLDVSDYTEVGKIFNKINRIDILVNNAGIFFASEVQEMNVNKWKELIGTNLNGTMYCSKAVLGQMIKNNYGRIINISSVSGKVGEPFASAYSASKFGLIGFTQSLAQEVAEKGITVNAVCPGWVETEMAENILHDENYATLVDIPVEKLKSSSLKAVPIGRYIHPREVAYLTLYLASNYASAITGQAINICGGMVMH